MRLSSRKLEPDARCELSMTSMIDVVFLLLIFFMTTSAFIKTERELDPAIRVERRASSESPSDFEPVLVDVVRAGEAFAYRVGGRELRSVGELADVLRQLTNKEDGAFVRVSDEAPFQMAADAVGACKAAQFSLVSYVPLTSSP